MSTSHRHEVTDADTASALGSGDVDVLGTPRLIAWLEAATVAEGRRHLGPGQTSVGTRVTVRHRRPSAVGTTVEVTAELQERVGGGRLGFTVRAVDAQGRTVADGDIERAIVDRASFG
jgi:predicted thioesterase